MDNINIEQLEDKYVLFAPSIVGYIALDRRDTLENAIKEAERRIKEHPMGLIYVIFILKEVVRIHPSR